MKRDEGCRHMAVLGAMVYQNAIRTQPCAQQPAVAYLQKSKLPCCGRPRVVFPLDPQYLQHKSWQLLV